MTRASDMALDEVGRGRYGFELPLVSVVIVNYNYGQFLEAAVRSVFEQTYSRVECIVLDNASTDDSRTVLAGLATRYPALKVVERAANDGQSVASVEGFAATTGPYVVLFDADDVMLPEFLATHVFVHLSLRVPVGFTCSDMFQTIESDLVLGTFVALNQCVRSRDRPSSGIMRPVATRETALPLGQLAPVAEDAVHLVDAGCRDWPWASMSAFVFRRDALDMVMDNPALRTLASNFDVYVARGVNVITGSAIIDRALTVYRMHRSNVFARHPQLANVFNFERHGRHDHEQHARRVIIDHMFATSDRLLKKLQRQDDFWRSVRLMNDIKPPLRSADGRRSYLREKYAAALPSLRNVVPLPLLVYWALTIRMSPLRVLAAHRAP